uniref:Uncharacterized protein n=1 Tax=Arundo donax TaxID=35708 RepID=A0A0A8ZW74_ARUDO
MSRSTIQPGKWNRQIRHLAVVMFFSVLFLLGKFSETS